MSSGKLYSNGKARRCAHALQVIVSVLLETMLLSVSGGALGAVMLGHLWWLHHCRQRQRLPRSASTRLSGVSSWPSPQRVALKPSGVPERFGEDLWEIRPDHLEPPLGG